MDSSKNGTENKNYMPQFRIGKNKISATEEIHPLTQT